MCMLWNRCWAESVGTKRYLRNTLTDLDEWHLMEFFTVRADGSLTDLHHFRNCPIRATKLLYVSKMPALFVFVSSLVADRFCCRVMNLTTLQPVESKLTGIFQSAGASSAPVFLQCVHLIELLPASLLWCVCSELSNVICPERVK